MSSKTPCYECLYKIRVDPPYDVEKYDMWVCEVYAFGVPIEIVLGEKWCKYFNREGE